MSEVPASSPVPSVSPEPSVHPQRHTAFRQLPVVDISGLHAPDPARRRQAADALGQAAREAGFLYITGHRVPALLVQHLRRQAEAYFAQPTEAKMRDYIGHSQNHSGYVPMGEEQFEGAQPDLKEAYDVGFDLVEAQSDPTLRRPMLGPNQWTDFPGFKADVQAYYDAMFALSHLLFRGFALSLGLPENSFTLRISTPPSQLRLVRYPHHAQAVTDRPGIGAHTDYECFTILLPTADGLEVQNGAGEWIDAPVLADAFVINIGDMFEVMSNGRYLATRHRVRKVTQERYAFPFFCACDYDTVIAPLPELVPAGTASAYAPLVCGEHIYAQTLQTFAYLKRRVAEGRLQLPEGAKGLSAFGYKAAPKEPA